MKWSITCFSDIRHMKKNQLPLSTVIYPPKFFSKTSRKPDAHFDKNDVLLGLTLQWLVPRFQEDCPCESKRPDACSFMKKYEEQLSEIDFKEFKKNVENVIHNINIEIKYDIDEAVLIVYEKASNPCSERHALKRWFHANGIELEDFEVKK